MHLLVRERHSLDETEAAAEDLGLAAGDVLFLSFSDSDLATAAAAWRANVGEPYTLRLANLSRLRHPMSVDLLIENTLPGTRAVLVRLLGGLDYWRYGAEELFRVCSARGIALAVVAGDGRPDPALGTVSTLPPVALARLEALLDAGGPANTSAALAGLLAIAGGDGAALPEPIAMPDFGRYEPMPCNRTLPSAATAVIVFYRAFVLAGDTAPIDALANALHARGVTATALFVPSLKAPAAARWLRDQLTALAPDVILNATAFAARDGEGLSPLEAAGCPILQVIPAIAFKDAWAASPRGLGAADLAMHVALPEIDGRIDAGVISFKEALAPDDQLGFSAVRHAPDPDGVAHAASLAATWANLRRKPPRERRIALMLSTYPGRADQIAHAVGLDGPASAARILDCFRTAGYELAPAPADGRSILTALTAPPGVFWPAAAYRAAFDKLPAAFRESVLAAWGPPESDPAFRDGALDVPVHRCGNVTLVLQPDRGALSDRKSGYHDPATPPRHGYIAAYLWLREVARIEALIHLGTHGTLEWLPGKAVALSPASAPRALLGPVPVIYPFIVNDPGEAAQAKRRISAVTLGHKTPPLIQTVLDGKLAELERLADEFASADGLDPKRRALLTGEIAQAAHRAGIADACGLTPDLSPAECLARIDAFLCDVKELTIRDGLHILDQAECAGILHALDGRFIEPGPAGAPSRGRPDVLPTGRNLYTFDPRTIPTQTAYSNGQRAAAAIMQRYGEDHGDWPRAIVLDLWGSASLRTGGEEFATALALIGVKPIWDHRSFRVSGYEIIPAPLLERPRVDVTLRISGLCRDMFGSQLGLFAAAVDAVAKLREEADMNPLAHSHHAQTSPQRIFGPAAGSYGAGVMARIDAGDWANRDDLGQTYLDASSHQVQADGSTRPAPEAFAGRVAGADAFVHIQDHRETDLLTGGDYAAHEGGFAAAARALGNVRVALYHGDTGIPEAPKIRTLDEECARVVLGRAASTRWINGQMRHGFRGAAEIAAALDAAFAFAATAGSVSSPHFDALYEAYLADARVREFLARENPAALAAIRARFEEARFRGLWTSRRNDLEALAAGGAS